MKRLLIMLLVLCFAVGLALAASDVCPEAVKAAIIKAYPGATVESCKKEEEKGTTVYEAKVTTKQALRLELDVAPDGKILQTEQKIGLETVPNAVLEGFHAKYKDVKPTAAEKQTKADGTVQYELAFGAGKQKREVTLSESGKILEEE
ncbi:MAG TPA: hypothetical protein VLC46_09885 [Thermoanaerobaculia bacterium]|jgi:uncharacterized membrane protein YkoI|nr:hypothetical protein [Thermoanaerobaculia bacterium]